MVTFFELLMAFNLFSISATCALMLGKKLRLKFLLSLSLFLWHTFFCIYYWYFSHVNVADATTYYNVALRGEFNWMPGTRFVESFTTFFVSGLGLDKLSTFLVYNLFGAIGMLLLANIVLSKWPIRQGWRKYVPYLVVFMPGLSFWSSAIGKDAPAFFAACLATYALLDIRCRKILFVFAVLLMFAVRPHVAGFMIIAIGIAFVTGRQVKLTSRIVVIALIFGAGAASFPFIVKYVGLGDNLSNQAVYEYIEKRQSYNLEGGSSVDISALPLPLKIATFLFRPLFFDATGFVGLVVSVENLFLIGLFLFIFVRGFSHLMRGANVSVRYNLIFFSIALLVFSLTIANMGIAVRQKTMLLPSFFFLICYAAERLYVRKNNRKMCAQRRHVWKQSYARRC